jgi:hypothetical protein
VSDVVLCYHSRINGLYCVILLLCLLSFCGIGQRPLLMTSCGDKTVVTLGDFSSVSDVVCCGHFTMNCICLLVHQVC